MRLVAVLMLLLWTLPAQAQVTVPSTAKTGTVRIDCPSMYVRKVGLSPNLWRADRINSTGQVTFSDGTVLQIPNVIASTYVRRALGKTWVDECQAIGTAIDGSKLTLNLPREEVVFTRIGVRTALEMHATGTMHTPDGRQFSIEVTYPACQAQWKRPGLRLAEPVTAIGTVTFENEGTRP
jgi:hypothetical protein